jgi:transposase
MSEQASATERRIYSAELKQEAVRLVLESGLNNTQAGRKLGVPPKTVGGWVTPHRKANRLKAIEIGLANDDPAALKQQNIQLQKENARLRMERDILKKFSQYAASQMPGGLP